jgi:soluble lytic murein transglycosylase-like protein
LNISADPRVVKQLLLSQWINNANPLDPSQTALGEDGNLFGMLLNDLMNSPDMTDSSLAALETSPQGLPSIEDQAPIPAASLIPALADDQGTSSRFDSLIAAAAAKYGLDPALIKGVIQSESGFKADAVSHAGAKGLMQLMDATARGLGVTDSLDPAQNIDGGARFLSYLLRRYDGHVSSALAAYNAGPGRVDRLGLTTDALVHQRLGELPQETQNYIHKVLAAAQKWSKAA